jgi:hypothetical protein
MALGLAEFRANLVELLFCIAKQDELLKGHCPRPSSTLPIDNLLGQTSALDEPGELDAVFEAKCDAWQVAWELVGWKAAQGVERIVDIKADLIGAYQCRTGLSRLGMLARKNPGAVMNCTGVWV